MSCYTASTKKSLLGVPVTEEIKERTERGDGYMNHLKTVGCGPGQNSGEPKPPSFSPGLHLGPTAQRDQPEKKEEEGLRLWASLEVHSLSLLLSSHLRNVSKLGGREPQPLEVRLCSLTKPCSYSKNPVAVDRRRDSNPSSQPLHPQSRADPADPYSLFRRVGSLAGQVFPLTAIIQAASC